MARDQEWRKKEESLSEVVAKYPKLPPSFILKVDVYRRGVLYSDAALKLVDKKVHQLNEKDIPVGLSLTDGSILVGVYYDFSKAQRDPYLIDVVDGKPYITDNGVPLAEVSYWEKPDFFDKLASNGKPLSYYASARPQRLDIYYNGYCHFWDKPGEGCKYCSWTPDFNAKGLDKEHEDIELVEEAVREAFKQPGRFSSIMMTGGSILTGKELLDDEVDGYIRMWQMIGKYFQPGKRFPSQLIASAFNERQLERLYENTGVMTYTTDLEILDEKVFNWVCEGKANHVGYQEWKRRLYAAVDIFGRGNVNSGIVLGCELAQPNGFQSEDEAHKAVVETAHELAEHGISLGANVWRSVSHSVFQYQNTPSLDYYAKTFLAFDKLHHQYSLGRFIDDYRRCGMHPGLDLARI
jgi:hypothetical protein